MPSISVLFVRDGDAPPWQHAIRGQVTHVTDPVALAVVDGGMQSGKASIGIKVDLPDGNTVIAETSLDAWIAATCAMRGAFPAQFAGTPLAGNLG